MMIPAYSFDILNENDLIATVKVSNDVVSVEKYCNKIGIQPFYGGDITRNRIEDFLKSRCFDRNRSDCSELLLNLGLTILLLLALVWFLPSMGWCFSKHMRYLCLKSRRYCP